MALDLVNTYPGSPTDSRQLGTSTQAVEAENRTTNYNYTSPLDQFLQSYIQNLFGSNQQQVPEWAQAGAQNLVTNPGATANVAGAAFQQVANPLIASLQPQFQQEQNNLRDIMRKNGALQSGASAYETSRLIENQGNRAGQLLASNYVPLLNQINTNVQQGVGAGIKIPQANTNSLASILNTAYKPTSTEESGTTLPSATYYNPVSNNPPNWQMYTQI